MKSVLNYILKILGKILLIPILLIGLLCLLFYMLLIFPIEYLVYRNSSFYKCSKIKFKFGIMHSNEYKIFNKLHALNIDVTAEYINYEVRLIIHDESDIIIVGLYLSDSFYNEEREEVYVKICDEQYSSFDEMISEKRSEYNLINNEKLYLLINNIDGELNEVVIEKLLKFEGVVIFEDYFEVLKKVLNNDRYNITEMDYQKHRPILIYRIILVFIYSIFGVINIPIFFNEGRIVFIVIGLVLVFAFLSIIYIELNKSRLFRLKEIKLPKLFDSALSMLGFLMLIEMIISVFK